MANATPSRLGQDLLAGDEKALYIEQYAGEVLTAYETMVQMEDKHLVRHITAGKSADFPMTWKIGSGYHTPGNEITGRQVKHTEKSITVDDLLLSDVFIANIDEAMNHYETRSIYSEEQGRELAKQFDLNVGRNIILASRDTETFPGDSPVGYQYQDANMATQASAIAAGIFAAKEQLAKNDVPGERYGTVDVASYFLLAQHTDLMNRDWGSAGGDYSRGEVGLVAGIPVFLNNNVPQADDRANTALPTKYRADYSTTVGLVWTKYAAGTVKLMDLAMEQEYDIRRQGTLMVAKYAVGHGKLRPECAIELRTGAPLV